MNSPTRHRSWILGIRGRVAGAALALKNLAGALHTDGVGHTLSVGREVKMETPVRTRELRVQIGGG